MPGNKHAGLISARRCADDLIAQAGIPAQFELFRPQAGIDVRGGKHAPPSVTSPLSALRRVLRRWVKAVFTTRAKAS